MKSINNYKKLILVTIITFLISGCLNTTEKWSQYLGNSHNTGFSKNTAPHEVENLKWIFQSDENVNTSPIVSNNTVFVGSKDNYLYAIDVETGKMQWEFKDGENLYSFVNPATVNDIILCSFDKNLVAINIKTGQEEWKFETQKSVSTSPLINGDIAIIGTYENILYAIDTKTGQEEWKINTDKYLEYKPALANGVLYYGSYNNDLHAFDISSNKLKWKNEDIRTSTSPAIYKNLLFIGGKDGFLHAFSTKSGTEKWKFKLYERLIFDIAPGININPIVSNNTVFISISGDNSNVLFALNTKTGQEKWRFEANEEINTSPIATEDVVFVGSNDGYIYALDIKTGQEIWDFKTNDYIKSSPAIANGYIFFVGDYLYAVE